MKIALLSCLLISILILPSNAQTHPVRVIFDTDMGPDYDDVGALAMLHALADAGEAEILATIACTNYGLVGPVLSVINTYFNRPQLPVGVAGEYGVNMRDWQFWSDTLVSRYPHSLKNNSQAHDAVKLYRELLASQPDTSVTLITVGFLSNVAELMKSGPDRISTLSGMELIEKKVKKMVSMAGKFPEGMEFNIEEDAEAASYVFAHWTTPELIFSGFEIGVKIKSGLGLVKDRAVIDSPIKDVYSLAIPMASEDREGRMSWDQTAVLVGVRGSAPYYALEEGKIVTQPDGYNTWDSNGKGHYFLKELLPVEEVEAIINELMHHQPKK